MIQTNGRQKIETAREPLNDAARNLSGRLTDICANAMEATDAQLSICALKATRAIVIAVFSIVAIVAMTVIAGYGFFLLDGCLASALSIPPLPGWLAPLARGLIYLLVPTAGLCYLWHTLIGFDKAD